MHAPVVVPSTGERAMLCERCGEVAETFMTEHSGELCERCLREVEQERQRSPMRPRRPAAQDEG